MNNTLFINACARPNSRTFELAKTVLEKTGGKVNQVNLYETPLAPLDIKGLEKRNAAVSAQDFSDSSFCLAKQFAAADTIVIAAPFWDLMFPAVLKIYLENIAVCGITFDYTDMGRPKGLCNAKSLYFVTTAGGFIGENDFGFFYVKALAKNFFEIPNVKRVAAEGLDIDGANVVEILNKAKNDIK